jgi:hypothetical protein
MGLGSLRKRSGDMSDYQQKIRDVILEAVNHEIPIYAAQEMVEAIMWAEINGDK